MALGCLICSFLKFRLHILDWAEEACENKTDHYLSANIESHLKLLFSAKRLSANIKSHLKLLFSSKRFSPIFA